MSNLIFGCWKGKFGWRVEWVENGVLTHKDFYQDEFKTGKAKEDADAFRLTLGANAA